MDNIKRRNRLKNKKKKKALGFKIFIGFILVVLALIVVGGGYVVGMLNKMDNSIKVDTNNLGIEKEEISQIENSEKIINIALFGVDSTDGNNGRSDATMVATLDPVHKKLKLISFMRDSYVYINGHGQDKLNHAYAFGGPELAIRTLNENFGLNIEDFITVNFSSLPIIINTLGGVDIEIASDEITYINEYIDSLNRSEGTSSPYITYAGLQHLDGIQALAYSRVRYTAGGDYKRTERQRTVLNVLFTKIASASPTSYNSLLNEILPHVQTSLSSTEILSLGTKVLSIGTDLEQDRFPRDGYAQGTMIGGVSYIAFDMESTKQQVRDYIFEDIQ